MLNRDECKPDVCINHIQFRFPLEETSMKHLPFRYACPYFILGVALLLLLFGCSAMRTEFYREESKHLYNQAKADYERGDYHSAREHFTRITEHDPACAHAWVGLGNICYLDNDMKTAETYYRKAVGLDPGLQEQIQAHTLNAAYKKKQLDFLKKPFNLQKALYLLSAGNTAEFDRLASASTSLAEVAQATFAVSFAEIADLEIVIRKRLADNNAPPETRLFCGYFLLFNTAGGREHALLHIQETAALVADPLRQEAFTVLGRHYCHSGDVNKAIIYFKAALEAGAPMESFAPELAKIYRIPLEDKHLDP
jgi:tetratricopeptide (TPR) repeat protein